MHLELTDVSHGFDGDPVLEDVSLAVADGEIVTIIGPSGAGKTTLLRLASLFEPPGEGAVRCDGVDPWALAESERLARRRRIGVVFQRASLFDATVARNVEAGLRVRRPWRERLIDAPRRLLGRSTTDGDERIERALALVGLEEHRERHVESLSGGEAQRIAFARALAYDPDLLVLDEPTSDLDPRNTAILEHAVSRASDRGHGVLLATHDMHQARRLSDRVGVLLDGELIEVGPATRVFESPRDPRTRRFVDGDLLYDAAAEELPDVETEAAPTEESRR
ncbi:amino acid ABC transporter ATP-binding protein [Halovivax sp.]|uniref:amino acid ABC transporter ATP-binding protein n=1 Tax=Halovivax sp. TaxID=1935978 RepID=UPI0025C27EEF|nr:phosphate ABC transporter ATP-binding protein [Halovivax sp.]